MRVYKKRLPKGVRKEFRYDRGIKVKVLNTLYEKKKTKKEDK